MCISDLSSDYFCLVTCDSVRYFDDVFSYIMSNIMSNYLRSNTHDLIIINCFV